MDQQWDFFKKGGTSGGIFYPLHYIVAGYGSLADARAAESAFRDGGVAGEDVRSAPGKFVVEQLQSSSDPTTMEKIGNALSDLVGTETEYLDQDKTLADRGGAFLFLFAPNDEDVAGARSIFVDHPPVFARRYLRVAIEDVIRNLDEGTRKTRSS